jgi:hypothetical protein
MHSEAYLQWFDKIGKERPSIDVHGTSDEIRERLKPLECSNWHLEGNLLKCDTPMGPLAQTISTDYILIGEKDGLPILKKVA